MKKKKVGKTSSEEGILISHLIKKTLDFQTPLGTIFPLFMMFPIFLKFEPISKSDLKNQ